MELLTKLGALRAPAGDERRAVRPEVFEVGAVKGNRFRIPFNALPGNVDEVEAGSLLGRKRQASSSILSSQVARSRVSSRFSS